MRSDHAGDPVRLVDGRSGTVVSVIERGEYAAGLDTWRWAHERAGLVIPLGGWKFVLADADQIV